MKSKKLFFIFCALFACTTAIKAQDVIVLQNGDEIQSIVQEIGLNEVKYKKYENPNGPVYSILKTDVFMIKYQNGLKDVFSSLNIECAENVEKSDLWSLLYSKKISDKEMLHFLKENDKTQQFYQNFHSACVKGRGSAVRMGIGGAIALVGDGLFVYGLSNEQKVYIGVGIGISILGTITVAGNIQPLIDAGRQKAHIKYNFAKQYFNNKHTQEQIPVQLDFGVTQNGIGLILKF